MHMRTIVIVDDHPGFRRIARAILEADGYRVVGEAGTGASGIEAARALRPEVVLVDVGLPDIDGFAVAAALGHEGPPPVVVLTSSRDGSVYADRLRGHEGLRFVTKDDLSGELLSAIVTSA